MCSIGYAIPTSRLQVLVPKRSEFKGKMIEVDIYEAGKHFLKGRPAEDSKPFTPSIAAPLEKGAVSGLMQVISHRHTLERLHMGTSKYIDIPDSFIEHYKVLQ